MRQSRMHISVYYSSPGWTRQFLCVKAGRWRIYKNYLSFWTHFQKLISLLLCMRDRGSERERLCVCSMLALYLILRDTVWTNLQLTGNVVVLGLQIIALGSVYCIFFEIFIIDTKESLGAICLGSCVRYPHSSCRAEGWPRVCTNSPLTQLQALHPH